MISKSDLIKMARHVARRSEGYADPRIMHPARDWLIGLSAATALFLALSAAAGYLFWSRNSHDPYGEVTLSTVTYDRATAEAVLTRYRERSLRYRALGGIEASTAESIEAVGTTSAPTVAP